MDISFIVSIFFLVALSIYWILVRNFQYWKNRHVPFVVPELFYGNARGLSREYHTSEFFKRMYLQLKPLGSIGGVYIYMIPTAVVTSLDLIRTILIKDFHYFPNRGTYYNEKDDPISAHLINIEDESWKSLRQKVAPTFSTGKLKIMFRTICKLSDNLVAAIQRETDAAAAAGQIDVNDVLSRYTTDVIASTAFGIDCNSLFDRNTKFYEMIQKHVTTINVLKRTFLMRFPDWGRKLNMKIMNEDVSAFYLNVVAETIKNREDNDQLQRDDYMDLLIKLKNSTGPGSLTLNQVAAQCAVFFLAGFDNSAALLNFCMYELAKNKVIQKKARESVKDASEKVGFTFDTIHEMTYLEQCVNEALRKYPTVDRLIRRAKHDYNVPNSSIILERGTSVVIPVYGIHRDPDIYPEPDKFDPDRFTPEAIAERHPLAFLPFGDGPRGCIAQKLGLMEVKLALAKILTNFEMTLDQQKTSVPLSYEPGRFGLFPAGGIYIHFEAL